MHRLSTLTTLKKYGTDVAFVFDVNHQILILSICQHPIKIPKLTRYVKVIGLIMKAVDLISFFIYNWK